MAVLQKYFFYQICRPVCFKTQDTIFIRNTYGVFVAWKRACSNETRTLTGFICDASTFFSNETKPLAGFICDAATFFSIETKPLAGFNCDVATFFSNAT